MYVLLYVIRYYFGIISILLLSLLFDNILQYVLLLYIIYDYSVLFRYNFDIIR